MSDTEPSAPHTTCCGHDACCGDDYPVEEPSLLARTLERLIGVVAALCLMALMIGGTVALLRWWL